MDALAKAGLANVLARPNVTASSGETASFFSGGEYPLPTGFEDGVIVFEYKKYGVLLDFVPTIIDEDRIELTVRPEVSEPSQDNSVQVVTGVNVPVINVRRAETTVEMGDGESIVIAGLFRSASNEVESGVPLLKDLPLCRRIFRTQLHASRRARAYRDRHRSTLWTPDRFLTELVWRRRAESTSITIRRRCVLMFTEPFFSTCTPFRKSGPNRPVARSGNLDFSICHRKNSLRAKIGPRSIYCRSETLCDMQIEPTLPASSTCIDHLRLSPNLSNVDISSLGC